MQRNTLTAINFNNEDDIKNFITLHNGHDTVVVGADGHSYWLSDIILSTDDSKEILAEKNNKFFVTVKEIKDAQKKIADLKLTNNFALLALVDEIKKTENLNIQAYTDSCCPIALEIFADSLICPCGHSFEAKEIKQALKQNGSCSLDRKEFKEADLRENHALKKLISLCCSLAQSRELETQKQAALETQSQKEEKEAQRKKAELEIKRQKAETEARRQQAQLKTEQVELVMQIKECEKALKEMPITNRAGEYKNAKENYDRFVSKNKTILQKYNYDQEGCTTRISMLRRKSDRLHKESAADLSLGMGSLLISCGVTGGLIVGGFFTGGLTWAIAVLLAPIILPVFGVSIYKFVKSAMKKNKAKKAENKLKILEIDSPILKEFSKLKGRCDATKKPDRYALQKQELEKLNIKLLEVNKSLTEVNARLNSVIQRKPAEPTLSDSANGLFRNPANNSAMERPAENNDRRLGHN